MIIINRYYLIRLISSGLSAANSNTILDVSSTQRTNIPTYNIFPWIRRDRFDFGRRRVPSSRLRRDGGAPDSASPRSDVVVRVPGFYRVLVSLGTPTAVACAVSAVRSGRVRKHNGPNRRRLSPPPPPHPATPGVWEHRRRVRAIRARPCK